MYRIRGNSEYKAADSETIGRTADLLALQRIQVTLAYGFQ